MQEAVADLEQQPDASASSEPESRFPESINTAPDVLKETVEVETEAEEVEAEPESEADSSPAVEENDDETIDAAEASDGDPEDGFSDRVKARIDEVTGKWRETERYATTLEQQLQEMQKRLADVPRQEEPFKSQADFDYDEAKYNEYLATEVSRRAEAAAQRAAEGFESKQAEKLAERAFADKEAEFEKTVKDYRTKVYDPSLAISLPMKRVFQSVDGGAELAYFLGNNPDVSRKLAGMPAEQAGFELGVIKANLAAEKQKVTPPKVTKAPPPTPKIKAGDAGMTKNPADMTDNEFRKWRLKQIASR